MELYRALINIIWIKSVLKSSARQYEYNLNLWLFRSAFLVFGNKKCFESNIDATAIECDIDQESSVIHWKALPSMQKGHVCNCYVIILEWLQMTLFLTSTKMKWSYTLKTGHGPSKNNRREKLTFDGYILLKDYVGWPLEINKIKLQIRISKEFVCKTYLLTGF